MEVKEHLRWRIAHGHVHDDTLQKKDYLINQASKQLIIPSFPFNLLFHFCLI